MVFYGLALVVSLLSLVSHARPCTEQEESALLSFLAALSRDGGLATSLQKGTTDCCSWEGISCNEEGAVVEVVLAGKGLEGHVSPALGDLTGLLRLNLSHNSLSGGLPLDHLMSSSSTLVIDISFNRLQGELLELPSSMIRPYRTSAPQVPASFCLASASLVMLDLSFNQFTGNIPPELGNCSTITVLNLGHNRLNGTIPDELFSATSLEVLSLRYAGLQGTLGSAHVARLINLVTLDLGENHFTGEIPDSIGQLKRLEVLRLDYNTMSGELPLALDNCTNLKTIDLRSNYFSGELSRFNFSTLQSLERLDLMENKFIGMIPESIYSCTNLTALRLSDNSFYGELSPKIATLNSLNFLSLYNNSFINISNSLQILKRSKGLKVLFRGMNFMSEAMPQDKTMNGFYNLQALGFHGCSLTANVPRWLSSLRNLEILLLSNSRLTGWIPGWINHLNHLSYLDLSNNSLTGCIPTALLTMKILNPNKTAAHSGRSFFALPMYLTFHQYLLTLACPIKLDLSNNNFTGEIPQDISQLKALNSLNLSFNRFSGQIPQGLSGLTDLQVSRFVKQSFKWCSSRSTE